MNTFLVILTVFTLITTANSAYVLSPTEMTWSAAKSYCEDTFQTTLATITTDQQKDQALAELTSGEAAEAWIGLNNKEQADYKWIDTDCGYLSKYQSNDDCSADPRWKTGNPSAEIDECAILTANGYNDIDCDMTERALCNNDQGFTICIAGDSWADLRNTNINSKIMARIWYINVNYMGFPLEYYYVSTDWEIIGTKDNMARVEGLCVDVDAFDDYEGEDWAFIDFYDCTEDQFIMNAVGYLGSNGMQNTLYEFTGECVIHDGNNIEISYRYGDCRESTISLDLESKIVYANPDWITAEPSCSSSARERPMQWVYNEPQPPYNPANNDIMVKVDGNTMIMVS